MHCAHRYVHRSENSPCKPFCIPNSSLPARYSHLSPYARFPFKWPNLFEFLNNFLQTVGRHITTAFCHTVYWLELLQSYCLIVTVLVKVIPSRTQSFIGSVMTIFLDGAREKQFVPLIFITNAIPRVHDMFFLIYIIKK